MTQRRFFRGLTRVHKWAGLIIGLQIMIWFTTGLFFTINPIEEVRGWHLVDRTPAPIPNAAIIPMQNARGAYTGELTSVSLIGVGNAPIYVFEGDEGRVMLDARDGSKFGGPTKDMVASIAERIYQGPGVLESVTLITEKPPKDYRAKLPVWQVKYHDRHKTRLYIDAETGVLHTTRTQLWRVFDTMWMLHIMDYKERDNINNWWLRLVGFAAWLFAITGVLLLVHRFLLKPKRRKT